MLLQRPERREARLRVSAVRGYDEDLRHVVHVVEQELGFRAADQPLLDEVAPPGPTSKVRVPLQGDQRADIAAVAVLQRLLDVIEANFEGTIADVDSEFLHDLRVSVRRSRAVQRELKGVFPREELERFRSEYRWLQQATGDSRDLDVYVLEFEDMRALVTEELRADLDPLLDVLRGRRLAARREMASALRSERATSLLSEWSSFLERLEGLPVDDRPDATRPIAAVAGKRIRKVYKRMVKMGRAIDESSPAEDYHELRKKGKELRYLLELFAAPLYPADVVKPMIKALKGLQDVLGHHQDREVQIAMLMSMRDEVSAVQGGAPALMAMGMLVQRLGEDELESRAQFAERFEAFASKSQRKMVKATFG
jgi:CHAD domain-containing protein